MGLKQNTQIPIPHLLRLMRSDLVIISIMSLPWTKLLIFCLTIGQLESLSGLAITELELCLCKLNIHFATITFLSFYDHAKKDCRFLEALDVLKSKTQDGQIVVERVVPKLGKLSFCKKGKPSISATKRYNEILHNLG